MAVKRTGISYVGVTWSERQIRHHGAGALRYAKQKALATQLDIASWCRPKVSERLVRKWLKGESLITFAVLGSGRLRPHILHYLGVCHRRVRKTMPRMARARKGAR